MGEPVFLSNEIYSCVEYRLKVEEHNQNPSGGLRTLLEQEAVSACLLGDMLQVVTAVRSFK